MSDNNGDGLLELEEVQKLPQYPSKKRFEEGPVAVIECPQKIPCNPCENSCPQSAITVGRPLTNLPQFDEDLCTGCGRCIGRCPGLAVFVVDKTFGRDKAAVSFPHEFLPLPREGEPVEVVDRRGGVVTSGLVLKVNPGENCDYTPVITAVIRKKYADLVRGMKLSVTKKPKKWAEVESAEAAEKGELIICRCEEVTQKEIMLAVDDGAETITGIKRRTRAGMGLCQGSTCGKLVSQLLSRRLKSKPEFRPDRARPPLKPITFGALWGDDD